MQNATETKEGRKMIEIIMNKLFLVNIVYKLFGNNNVIKERTITLTNITAKNGLR